VLHVVSLVAVVLVCGCDRKSDGDGPGPAPKPSAIDARSGDPGRDEQDRFDRERRPDLIVAALGIGPGSRVADVGAGSGLLTIHLARAVVPDGKVVATDIERRVLDLMMTRLAAAKLDHVVEMKVVEEDEPGLDRGAFDAILLSEVDHYFKDRVAWLEAAAPALKSGGRLVITNRIHHRARSLADAAKAGLKLVSESSPLPSHFIAIYKRP
jgi:precorrin-6B methylase 2